MLLAIVAFASPARADELPTDIGILGSLWARRTTRAASDELATGRGGPAGRPRI